MKVAYVAVDHLAVAVERQRRPEVGEGVVVVGGEPHERKAVYDVSAEGWRLGIRPGMPLRQAHQLCPDAVFLPSDEPAYERAREALWDLLEEFSPYVEPDGWDGAYFDAAGLTLLFGPDETLAARVVAAVKERYGFSARIGVGPGKYVARLAARYATKEPVVVTPEASARFLARQSVSALPLGPEARERLRRLGVRSLGDFAKLPAKDITLQLGAEGARAHRLARGIDDAPLAPRSRPRVIQAARSCEPPLTDGEQLRTIADHLVGRLAARLASEMRSCRTATLRLSLASGEQVERAAQLPRPTADEATLRRVIRDLSPAPSFGTSDAASADPRRAGACPPPQTPPRTAGDKPPPYESHVSPSIHTARAEQDGSIWADGVARVEVALEELGGGVAEQLGLFVANEAQRQKRAELEAAIAQVRRRFGDDRIRRIVVADEDAWLASRRYATENY